MTRIRTVGESHYARQQRLAGRRFYVARRSRMTGKVIKWIAGPFDSEREARVYAEGWGAEIGKTWIDVIALSRKPRGRAL